MKHMITLSGIIFVATLSLNLASQQIDQSFGLAGDASKLIPDDCTSATVSNVLKTKHDTVKNSINNVR
jgi:hypothetical protein